jgi:beta-lactamase regulating signal transducer with metallopeptidase domain
MNLQTDLGSDWGLASYIIEPAVRSFAVAILAGILLSAIRVKDASIRLAVWKTTLLAGLAMPLLGLVLPGIHVAALQAPATPAAETRVIGAADEIGPARSALRVSEVTAGSAEPPLQGQQSEAAMNWWWLATALYLLGVALLLARLVFGVFLTRRLRRASQPISDAGLLAILRVATHRESRLPPVAESNAVVVPVTLGVKRPLIVLPREWRRWEAEKLLAVLAHEAAHVERRDPMARMLSALNRCFFWFSPMSWWLHHHLAELVEEAADDRALQTAPDRTYYAQVLLGFFETLKRSPGRVRGLEVSMARGRSAERRLDRVLIAGRAIPHRLRRYVLVGVLLFAAPLVYLAAAVEPGGPQQLGGNALDESDNKAGRKQLADSGIALELTWPSGFHRLSATHNYGSFIRNQHVISDRGRIMTVFRRNQLTINDPEAAGDLTGVDVWVDDEGSAMKVRLAIIYNDLANPEWWKDKKEAILGSYLIRKGESIRPAELAKYGIEPFQMSAVDDTPVELQPGEGPLIVNNTNSLKIIRLVKTLDFYFLWLKNTSDKPVVSYLFMTFDITTGNDRGGGGVSSDGPLIPAGGVLERERFYNLEGRGIRIHGVVFDDGSFEGDPLFAAERLAQTEGFRLGARRVLRMIEQTLATDDSKLAEAFAKLESDLRVMTETSVSNDASAMELLQPKLTSILASPPDERAIKRLKAHLDLGFRQAAGWSATRFVETAPEKTQGSAESIRNRSSGVGGDAGANTLRKTLDALKANLEQRTGNHQPR